MNHEKIPHKNPNKNEILKLKQEQQMLCEDFLMVKLRILARNNCKFLSNFYFF